MIQELTQNYSHLFERELLNEINQVGTFKEVLETKGGLVFLKRLRRIF